MTLEKTDLQITKEAYFKLFTTLRAEGLGIKRSYEQIEDLCNQTGYHSYYTSFESFKTAYYTREK
jgi:hypothetical protein